MLKFKAFKQEHCMAVLLQYCLDCFIKMCHYAPFSVDFDAVNIPNRDIVRTAPWHYFDHE